MLVVHVVAVAVVVNFPPLTDPDHFKFVLFDVLMFSRNFNYHFSAKSFYKIHEWNATCLEIYWNKVFYFVKLKSADLW